MDERLWNFHGQVGARLTQNQSVRGPVQKGTSWLVKILDPALLYMVDRYLNTLEKIWIDGILRERYWKQFMESNEKEWDKSIIMVCLFLVALFISMQRAGTACIIRILTPYFKPFRQSTVLLAVNVSFLAIPVTSGGSQSPQDQQQLWSSPAGLACQVSITASVASIIFGSLLQRQQNRRLKESAEEVVCACTSLLAFFTFL